MHKSDLISYRDGTPDDINLIYATWLPGQYYGDSYFSLIDKQTFMKNYHKVLEFILNSPNTVIKVACLIEDPTSVLSYAVLNKDLTVVHWAFTKKPWRGIGLAKDLIPTSVKTTSHINKVGVSIIRKKNITFNPFVINQEASR